MPFGGHTPEALLGRSDSKNPSTTCRGLTTSGRPCRRAIPAVLAGPDDRSDASRFCWQHKDQVVTQTTRTASSRNLAPLVERKSIDSLVERLGVTSLDEPSSTQRTARRTLSNRTEQVDLSNLSACQQSSKGITDSRQHKGRSSERRREHKGTSRTYRPGFWASLRCFGGHKSDDEYFEIVRHRHRPEGYRERKRTETLQPSKGQAMQQTPSPQSRMPISSIYPTYHSGPSRPTSVPTNGPFPMKGRAMTVTERLFTHIPKHLPARTTSTLLNELVKPISPHDDHGYIYIFWLTDPDHTPNDDTASSLLSGQLGRRTSVGDLARSYSVSRRKSQHDQRIMLKIGRANNVHRRMTEWTQQCGHALSLVRFYPYVPSSPPASPDGPRRTFKARHDKSDRPALQLTPSTGLITKVPHVHRVERLIHLELADSKVKRRCDACGKEHREWFEVAATEQGVKAVDETVRRWVNWAQNHVV